MIRFEIKEKTTPLRIFQMFPYRILGINPPFADSGSFPRLIPGTSSDHHLRQGEGVRTTRSSVSVGSGVSPSRFTLQVAMLVPGVFFSRCCSGVVLFWLLFFFFSRCTIFQVNSLISNMVLGYFDTR